MRKLRDAVSPLQALAEKHGIRRRVRRYLSSRKGLVVTGLVSGLLLGILSADAPETAVRKPAFKSAGQPFFQRTFGRNIGVKGMQPDGSFLFSDFETEDGLKLWKTVSADISRSNEFPSHGKYAARILFEAVENFGSVVADNLMLSRSGGSDWSRYEALQLGVYNPESRMTEIGILISDTSGQYYKEKLKIPAGGGNTVLIAVRKIAEEIDIGRVNQFALYARMKKPHVLFIDNIRLLPLQDLGQPAPGPEKETPDMAKDSRPFDYGFSRRKPAWLTRDAQVPGEIVRIPFVVKNETDGFCHLCAVEGGMPFPLGEVRSLDHLRLRNSSQEDLPFQARVLARWPDGSVKWAGVHFLTTLGPGEGAGFFLDYGPNIKTLDFSSQLKVQETPETISVSTGPLEFRLDRRRFLLFDRVLVDLNRDGVFSENETAAGPAVLSLRFQNRLHRTDLGRDEYTLAVEESGPQRAILRAEGWFFSESGEKFCKAIVRYFFYAGQSYVKAAHTLIYTGYPANEYHHLYKNINMPANEPVDSYGIEMDLPAGLSEAAVLLGRFRMDPFEYPYEGTLRLSQLSWESSRLEVNANPVEMAGAFGGWLDVSGAGKGVGVAIRHFRENYPKAYGIDAAANRFFIDLWPAEAGPLDLETTREADGADAVARGSAFGLAKTHEILFNFHSGDRRQATMRAASFAERLVLRPNPYWVDATGAVGRLYPEDRRYRDYEQMLEKLFDWAARQAAVFRWYGMLNFGDTLTWWRNEDETGALGEYGWHPKGRWGWYNVEGPGTHTGALLQFMRSGKWKYFEFGENLSRHIMDIDTVHYNTIAEDPRLRRKVSDAFSQVGSMHRHNANHWGGRNEESSHTSIHGLTLYYYLTGDPRVFEVLLEAGSFYLKEPFTYYGHGDTAPHRSLANALLGHVFLYEMTGDSVYKEAADKLAGIFLKGQQTDGSFLEFYNPETGEWFGGRNDLFMSWYDLAAFIAYHDLTQNGDVKEMILRLARYLGPLPHAGAASLHGLAYAYLLSGDPGFIRMAENQLAELRKSQIHSRNPLSDGMIYNKPIYHRPNIFLATVPYAFGGLEEHFERSRRK